MGGQEPARRLQGPDHLEDVLSSRTIAYPFRLLQCDLVTDGGALTLVAAERQELLHHTDEGRYPWQKWVPACAGKTSKRANPIAGLRRKASNADGGFHSSRAFCGVGAEAAITHRDVDHLMHSGTYGMYALQKACATYGGIATA